MSQYFSILLMLLVSIISDANTQTLTFIHLNDLHAHLTPHLEMVAHGDQTKIVEQGGLARIATLIKQIRQQNPNNVLMNVGDTYHGGVEALYTDGNAIVAPVNALDIDVGVPGNWDFAYGPMVTRARYSQTQSFRPSPMRNRQASNTQGPNFPNLAANVTVTQPRFLAGQAFLPPTLIKTIGSVPVGFIGITSDIVPEMHPILALGLSFLKGEHAYLELISDHAQTLRQQGAVVVVVMSELGIQKDYALANKIDSGLVDVFFSAHTHETTFKPLVSDSGAWVVESGNDTYLGQLDMVIANNQIIDKAWQLHVVKPSIPEDPEVKQLVEQARAPFLADNVFLTLDARQSNQTLDQPIDTVIAHSRIPLSRYHSLENSFNNSLTEMLRQRTGTQLAMSKGFRFGSTIAPKGYLFEDNTIAQGDITIEDVYRFFPSIYTFATGKITGERLKQIMEQGLAKTYSKDAFYQGGGWFEGFSGLQADIDLAAPDKQRILKLRLKDTGDDIQAEDILSITGCIRPMDYNVLCAFDGFTEVQALINPNTGDTWTNVDLFIDMVQNGQLPYTFYQRFNDINQTQFWPKAPFIQALTGVHR